MKYKLIIPSLFLVLISFSSAYAQKISVLSFNIRFASIGTSYKDWDQRKEGVYAVLRGYDFIGMQEVVNLQMEEISQKFQNDYSYIFRTREADPTQGEGCPILYKKSRWQIMRSGTFWLSDTPDIIGSNTWGAAFNRVSTFAVFRELKSGDSVMVINTHFDHISQDAREKSADLILKKFDSSIKTIPVIFLGDLNVTPDNQVYKNITGNSALSDSYLKSKQPKNSNPATFHGWETQKPSERIDYIFVSPKINVLGNHILYHKYKGNYPSDHFPVSALLEIKK